MRHDDDDPDVSQLSIKVAELTHADDIATQETLNPLPRPRRGEDITHLFTQASAALRHGQLVKDEFFTLFESVAALEVMDPKMDSGYSLPDQDAILENFDPLDYSSPEEILWIMDELLCAEMTWHDGYPLSQTLLASLHLHNLLSSDLLPLDSLVFRSLKSKPPSLPIVTEVLRAYCLALVKCCDHVILEVTSEHFYEEEDFVTANFTRDLLTTVPEEAVYDLLSTALATTTKLDIAPNLKEAISLRLEFRQLMLQAFRPMISPDPRKADLFKSLADMVPSLASSHELCTAPNTPVFSERVQRFLASNTPPRPLKQTTWQVALEKLSQVCDDTMAAFDVMQLSPALSSHALMRFVWEYTSRKPQPLTYSRAVMQGLLFKSSAVLGELLHLDLLMSDIRLTVLPASDLLDPYNWQIELPSSPRYQIARKIDDFLSRALDEFLHLYRMAMQNRCRIRRNFAQSVAILDGLQVVAEDYDANITNECMLSATARDPIPIDEEVFYPFANWVYFHRLQVMQTVVLMGFELEVYLPDELASSYALLSTFAREQTDHCGIILSVLENRLSPPTTSRLKRPSAAARNEIEASITYVRQHAMRSRVRSALSSALADLYSLLLVFGLLYTRPCSKAEAELRHELRLKPFLQIGCPDLPSAEHLASLTTARPPDTRLSDIRTQADAKLRLVRTDLATLRTADPDLGHFRGVEAGWQAEIKALTHVAVGTAVALAALEGAWTAAGLETLGSITAAAKEKITQGWTADLPAPEKRVHEWWIVPRILAKK